MGIWFGVTGYPPAGDEKVLSEIGHKTAGI